MLTVLTAIGGFIRIPFFPVPITLQTLFVYLSGNLVKRGWISQSLFLILGLIGVPVFVSGGGPGYVFHPTFGYLLGFPIAAFAIGAIRRNSEPSWRVLLKANLIGMTLIFVPGVIGLYVNINHMAGLSMSWKQALTTGALLFLPGEMIKIGLAVWLSGRLSRVITFT